MKQLLTLTTLFLFCIPVYTSAQTTEPSQDTTLEKASNFNIAIDAISLKDESSAPYPTTSNTAVAVDFDFECGINFFTFKMGSVIQKWSLINNTVTGGDTVLTGGGTSIAFCSTLGTPTFWTAGSTVFYYGYYDDLSSTWINTSNPFGVLNNGGHGADQYFMASYSTTSLAILHFDGTNFTTVDVTSDSYGVGDIAVDNQGRAWVFKSNNGSPTDSLVVLNSSGLVTSYIIEDNGFGHYGSFFLNNTLYVGNSFANSIYPIIINDATGTAEFGPAISFPYNSYFDCASCEIEFGACINSYTNLSVSVCDSYTSPVSNETWTSSGIYNDTLSNSAGCDSVIITDLMIFDSNNEIDSVTSCGPYLWNGVTYDSDTSTTITLINEAGCDSMVTLNLSIPLIDLSISMLSISACDSFTSPINNETWTRSGIYNDTIQNSIGCDSSVIVTDLMIFDSSNEIDSVTSCGPYLWNGVTYEGNISTTLTFISEAGCDSMVTLNLSIPVIDLSISNDGMTITSNTTDATYQWLDCDNSFSVIQGETNQSFTAVSNGSYALELSQNGCSDTTECTTLIVNDIDENYLDTQISIYPNPTNGNLYIDFLEVQRNTKVELLSVLGQVIATETLKEDKQLELNINQAPGLYLIKISNEQGNLAVYKILKQ